LPAWPSDANHDRASAGARSSWGNASTEELLMTWALGAVALIGAFGVLLWAAGQVAGLLTHGHWPGVRLRAALGVAVHLPADLDEPAAAWPPEVREQLAGPVVFYFVLLAFLVVILLTIVVTVGRWNVYRASQVRRERDRSTSWARRSQIRSLVVRGVPADRVVLGWLGRHLVAAEPRRSVLVVAPTQAGKTTRFVIPTVLRWNGPMVVTTSVKSDVLRLTLAERRRRGSAYVFDPTAATGIPGVKWSPLLTCGIYPDAERTAAWLIEAAGDPRGENAKFWEALAGKLLAPLLFAAAGTDRNVRDVASWVDRREVGQVKEALTWLGDIDALDAWAATCAREERQRDSVYGTAETILSAFASPSARAATEMTSQDHAAGRVLDVRRLLAEEGTLYVVAPAHEQGRLRPLFESLVQAVLRAAQDRYAATGAPLDPALMLMLDEAANIAPLRQLATYASTGAGQGIQICSVWQDLAQVEAIYGRRAATVINGHTARVFLAGSADLATLDATSRMIGDHETHRASVSRSGGGQRSVSESTAETRLAPVDYLRQVPSDTAVVLYGRAPVIRLKTRPWYDDPALRRVIDADAPAGGDRAIDRPSPLLGKTARDVDGHPQIAPQSCAEAGIAAPNRSEHERGTAPISPQRAVVNERSRTMNPISVLEDTTLALTTPAVPSHAISLAWHAAELGEEVAFNLVHTGATEDMPAYLTAADAFAAARRDLDDQVASESVVGISLAPATSEESPNPADVEVALALLARGMISALTDAARRSGDPDVALACTRASLSAADAGEACTRGHPA
jgi:type IV secretion system protein VirD4